jgi:hypothetical protein
MRTTILAYVIAVLGFVTILQVGSTAFSICGMQGQH